MSGNLSDKLREAANTYDAEKERKRREMKELADSIKKIIWGQLENEKSPLFQELMSAAQVGFRLHTIKLDSIEGVPEILCRIPQGLRYMIETHKTQLGYTLQITNDGMVTISWKQAQ
jgi:hypothetical protein